MEGLCGKFAVEARHFPLPDKVQVRLVAVDIKRECIDLAAT